MERSGYLTRAILLTLLLTSEIPRVNTARILMVMFQWPSLIYTKVAIGEDLVRRGHEVYIAVTSGNPASDKINKTGINFLRYEPLKDTLYPYTDEFQNYIVELIYTGEVMDWQRGIDMTFGDCRALHSDQLFLRQARSLQFDMAVIEPFICHPCYLMLPHILGIPYIISTRNTFPLSFRMPAFPSFYTIPVVGTYSAAITELNTFYGRLANTATAATFGLLALPMLWGNTTLLQKYAPEVESWYELFLKAELTMIENDHLLDDALPLLPHVVTVAGCTARPPNPLPDNLEKIFEQSADDGVILATFGSVAYTMRADTAAKFLDAFGRLKETVLIRMAVHERLNVPANVHLMQWLPQNDILSHPKTKLFITHCGKNGQYEALYHGVPMLGIPLVAEQPWNCNQAKKRGIGLCLDILDFTADQLYQNIREIIDNATYRTNIQKLSEIWHDEPMIGREKAGFWIEHVIKYGANHLRSPAIDQPLYQFLMLDIVALIVAGVLLLIFSIWIVLKAILKKVNNVLLKKKIE